MESQQRHDAMADFVYSPTSWGIKRLSRSPQSQQDGGSANLGTQQGILVRDLHDNCIFTRLPQELLDEIVDYLVPGDLFCLKLCYAALRDRIRPSFSELMKRIKPEPPLLDLPGYRIGATDYTTVIEIGPLCGELDKQGDLPFSGRLEELVVECLIPFNCGRGLISWKVSDGVITLKL